MVSCRILLLLAFVQQSAALVGPQLRRPAAHGFSTTSSISGTSFISTSYVTPPRARLQPLQATAEPAGPVVNKAMVRSIIINQIVVGYSIWLTNGDGRQLLSATNFDPTSLVVGAAGGLAVIAVGRFIEKSPNPLFAELNLSTNMLVPAAVWAATAAHRRRRRELGHSHARRVDRGDGLPRRRDVAPRRELGSFTGGRLRDPPLRPGPHQPARARQGDAASVRVRVRMTTSRRRRVG